jgi:hypothetical protein
MTTHRGQQRDKPFRDALRMEIAAAGEDLKELRRVARALLDKAALGDVGAIKEVADRLDGKVAQPVAGDDEAPAIKVEWTDDRRIAALKSLLARMKDDEDEPKD